MQINFSGKIVVVTGATRGIGKKIAEDLYALGATLLLTGTDRKQIKELNNTVKSDNRIKYFYLDWLEEKSINRFLTTIKSYKRIDVCINNAGINRINYLWDIKINDWDAIIKVNLRGPFILSKEIGTIMKKNQSGSIINIASILGVITKEKRAPYTAAKAGLIGFTKTTAIDFAPYNILVNSVSPGFILTDLSKRILTKKEIVDLKSAIPLKRFGTSEEISRVVLFLASGLNTYITGQNIVVDGGFIDV